MNTSLSYSVALIKDAFEQEFQPGTSKYTALYRAIKKSILNKDLPVDWVIPSTRKLATLLGFSRATVITAYELLQLEKLIVSKTGSGYRVAGTFEFIEQTVSNDNHTIVDKKYPELSVKGRAFLNNVSILNRTENNTILFKPGLPPIDIFPINRWKNLLNNYWRYIKSSELSYGQSSGSYELKQQISNYLKVNRAVHVSPDQVVVVSGSLQSIYLTASALINHGDAVALENPTFPNVHSIFKSFSATLLPVSCDSEGLDVRDLQKSALTHPLKLIHVTPTNHYPLGIRMSLNRRKELLEFCSETGAYILENDYEHEIGNQDNALPTLYALDNDARVIYLGTFNRLLYPSIRLGFMVVPKQLAPAIGALQEHSHRFVSPATQMVMGQFIDKGYLYQHVSTLKEVGQQRFELFLHLLSAYNLPITILQKEFLSLHVVLQFEKSVSQKKEQQIVAVLKQAGIVVFSLSKCFVATPVKTGLIVGFATVNTTLIRKNVKTLAQLLAQYLA